MGLIARHDPDFDDVPQNLQQVMNWADDEDINEEDILEFSRTIEPLMMDYENIDGEYKLVVKIINNSTNPAPTYAHDGDSGFDIRAYLPDGALTVPSMKRKLIPTGVHFAVPRGWELQIRPRSGNAINYGIMVLNSPGTVDSNYRGEVKVILYNTDENDFVINNGDRICQGVICPVAHNVKLKPVESLDETQRGSNGFGSSGKR